MAPMRLEVAAQTDVGCARTNNEDNVGYDVRHGVFVLCDGMGGPAAGELASRTAVESLLKYFGDSGPNGQLSSNGKRNEALPVPADLLAEAIQLANQAIREKAARQASFAGMGSTIVCALVANSSCSVGHVGDSRAYLIRRGAMQQLTQDHSLVMEQVRQGLISREQAANSRQRNVLLRALGPEETVEPDLQLVAVVPGDTLLLTSDGLTGCLSGEQILATITSSLDLQQACNNLVQAAKDVGGEDNITCLLIRFIEHGRLSTLFRRLFNWRFGDGKALSAI
jgi:serine/threonine protein phosphatase PrpC